jgi:ADP-glucose pyrophosphorylase
VLNTNLEWLARNGCHALVAEDAHVEQGVKLSRAVVGGGSRIEGPALINDVVIFPETIVPANASINRALLAPNLFISCVENK